MLITKADGEQEEFKSEKLERSLRNAGAEEKMIDYIVRHVVLELKPEMTTSEIYKHAFEILKKEGQKPVAARYSLKRAVLELGPSGFPFESFLAEIFRSKGYKAETDITIFGKCASHEIDVVAEKENELLIIEAKFHNALGARSDLQVALYVRARYDDLLANKFDGRLKASQKHRCSIFTNTSFTTNAYQYGECAGRGSLVKLIEETALHPLTALTTLSGGEKKSLLGTGRVLCRDIKDNSSLLKEAGIGGQKFDMVMDEINKICVPFFGAS